MRIHSIRLNNFRCFEELTLAINAPLVILEGCNGVGKTSILEALHYVCYLRSFRTHIPQELVRNTGEGFFIQVGLHATGAAHKDELHVGFHQKKRRIRVNQKPVRSYRELARHYRVITLTEDDLALIKEGPEVRRLFLDHALLLEQIEFMPHIRSFRSVVEQRNALLKRGMSGDITLYTIFTQQLWEHSRMIQEQRKSLLAGLSTEINAEVAKLFSYYDSIQLTYHEKSAFCSGYSTYEKFSQDHGGLADFERKMGRSLVGAHLDDFSITLSNKKSRSFSSRGEQKLVVLLLKIAQIKRLIARYGTGSCIFLLDDFMTDFDERHAAKLVEILLLLDIQLIFTSPNRHASITRYLNLSASSTQTISL